MASRSYQLTITAAAQRLSEALTDKTVGGPEDVAYRQLELTASVDCFMGSTAALTTSAYGRKLFAAAAGTQSVVIGPFESGPVKLSDLYVIGTSGTLNIFGIPF